MKRAILIAALGLALAGCTAAPAPDSSPEPTSAAPQAEAGPPAVGECFPDTDADEFPGQPPGYPAPLESFSVDPVCWSTREGLSEMSLLWWGADAMTAESEARAALGDLPEVAPGVFERPPMLFTLTGGDEWFRIDVAVGS